jgi:tetratricopeptide (TPR) repeat protein
MFVASGVRSEARVWDSFSPQRSFFLYGERIAMMARTWSVLKILSVCLLLATPALPQGAEPPLQKPASPHQGGAPAPPPAHDSAAPSSKIALVVAVVTEDGKSLAQQAFINLRGENGQPENWTTAYGKSEVTFQGLVPGAYKLDVGAAGFHAASQRLEIGDVAVNRVTVKLSADPFAILGSASPKSLIPADARKETQRGIEALNAGNLSDAEGHIRAAYKRGQESAELNYLMGVVYLRKKELGQAQTYLAKATAIDSLHADALTMLAQVRLEQEDVAGALNILKQALAANSQHWTAHSLMANVYLKLDEPEKARDEAQLAIQTSKGAGNDAQLPLGEALARLGQYQQAIDAFETFLRVAPKNPIAGDVRERINDLKAVVAAPAEAHPGAAPARSLADALKAEPGLSIPGWGAPGVDDVRPVVAPGVTCPQARVLEEAGQRLTELVDNISRFDAVEEIIHEDQDEMGKALVRITRKYAYVAMLAPPRPNLKSAPVPELQEDRMSLSGVSDAPAGISTRGLLTLAFIFHPAEQQTFEMACEGLGEWQGQAAWLFHFRQREDQPNYLQRYRIANHSYPIPMKGRAWIAASTSQVIHMEAELVHPIPEIRLRTQHYIVDYGLVRFDKKKIDLWLPKQAELYFYFGGHRYYRRHSFDGFRLFSVDSTEKVATPKGEDPPQ